MAWSGEQGEPMELIELPTQRRKDAKLAKSALSGIPNKLQNSDEKGCCGSKYVGYALSI